MPTRATETGLGPSVKQVTEHVSALARLEIELASIELKRKLAALGIGIGLGGFGGGRGGNYGGHRGGY